MDRAEFSYWGKYFAAERASIQPRPQEPIPIWLGAYKPRMLDLTGRCADGWIPSLFLLERSRRIARSMTFVYNLAVLVHDHGAPQPGRLAIRGDQQAEKLVELCGTC
ncbi:MAG: LLM class flavin-dependent oxidoreductase [Chloroflexi bacterium]|nr:LLM class flavin-dependent oxidoreductase [Chloroflexota bacterium]